VIIMKKKIQFVLTGIAAALMVVGCASGPSVAELNELTSKIVKASFRDEGFVKVDRVLNVDETNRACSEADVAGKPLDEKTAKAIEEMNLKAIKWPSDGK
jgi:sulfur-oxidizing protein SoxX